jgi:hypothetical protein
MEIERDVTVELVFEDRDPKGNLRAAFSSGPRASGSLPAYSRTELEKGLGPLAERIRGLFATTSDGSQTQAQALDARNVSGRPFDSPLPQKRFGS